jgi:hypothetical protein
LRRDLAVDRITAGARFGEHLARHLGQAEYIIEFAVCQQSGIEGDHGAAKLEHQATVKIEPKSIRGLFAMFFVRVMSLKSAKEFTFFCSAK